MRGTKVDDERGATKFLRTATRRQRCRSALRTASWNVCWSVAGLVAMVGCIEAWYRMRAPFLSIQEPTNFVPGVGLVLAPNAKVHWTNWKDFWTISRTNSIGFLDREPPRPERAATSCHISVVGDSFVEAREMPISDKLHVRLEELAGERTPHLDVTTSAWGRSLSGQIGQMPFYDRWIRPLRPKLVVLVFVWNDFRDNSGGNLRYYGRDPERPPNLIAIKEDDEGIVFRFPDSGWNSRQAPPRWRDHLPSSYFFQVYVDRLIWLRNRKTLSLFRPADPEIMAFALDQWKARTDRDQVALAILTSHSMGTRGDVLFDLLAPLAEARDIPVIDQAAWILRHGGKLEDAHWEDRRHWNLRGHEWAAEAVFAWLDGHQSICDEGSPRQS